MDNIIFLFSFVGGCLTSMSLVPQLVQIVRTGSVRDINLTYTLVLLAGTVCWFSAGVLSLFSSVDGLNVAIVFWNGFSLVTCTGMVFLKLRYSHI